MGPMNLSSVFEPPMKKRRPPVPMFTGSGDISSAEWERRRKAGLMDAYTPMHGSSVARPTPRASDCIGHSAEEEQLPPRSSSSSSIPRHYTPPMSMPPPQSSMPRPQSSMPPSSMPPPSMPPPSSMTPSSMPPPSMPPPSKIPRTTPQGSMPSPSMPHASATSSTQVASSGAVGSARATSKLEEVPDSIPEFGKLPNVGGRHAAVYGFKEPKTQESAKRAIALRLEPLKPELPSFERVLSESKQSVTIGSLRKSADVFVSDEAVSKKHCTLTLIGINGELALAVVDNSTNGTFVNNERLPARQKRFRIRNGDKLVIKSPGLDEDFGWKCDFGNTVAYFSRA